MPLHPGLYEQLITDELHAALAASPLLADRAPLPPDAGAELLAAHLFEAARRALRGLSGEDKLARQVGLTNAILAMLAGRAPEEVDAGDAVQPELLLSLMGRLERGLGEGAPRRPRLSLWRSDLLVNGPRDERVGPEILAELPSADGVDLLMSFVKWSGFVELRAGLQAARDRGAPIRVLTTTYMGATELEALEGLAALGAELRVSYDERRTRLHAKAWLFRRRSGFGTAIIGSSNLSSAALRDGCEWNVRLSQRETPGMVEKFQATFDQYWADDTFEPYVRARFEAVLRQREGAGRDGGRDALASVVRLRPYPHQQAALDALQAERAAGHSRNLVVAATGTGKTVIAALDYARQPGRPSLLFVAHRDRILDQSLATYRIALQDGNFGEKLTGRDRPVVGRHVFASVQSLHADRLAALDPAAYAVVVVDEFHHAAADTYARLLDHLRPRLLLGLTATPERADGRSVLGRFDGRVACALRLWDALDRDLLTPFQYFAVGDGTDLSQIDFRSGRYDVAALERLYTADELRAAAVLRGVQRWIGRPGAMRALGFCVSVAHAEFMAAYFGRNGLPAAVIEGRTSPADRDARVRALQHGELRAIFTVDVFNEGVDIPEVDTVLFLRPTESATLFTQQLGRGLRLHERKAVLTVLDFVGKAHRSFRFDLRLRALLGGGTRAELRAAVEQGFPRLPSGCAIQLEKAPQEVILANLRQQGSGWASLAADLSADMDLPTFLQRSELSLEELYAKDKCFTLLRQEAGFAPPGPLTGLSRSGLSRAFARLLHIDDPHRLAAWRAFLQSEAPPVADLADPLQRMFFAALGHERRPLAELPQAFAELWAEPALKVELAALLALLDDRRRRLVGPPADSGLCLHATYTRAEIIAAHGIVAGAAGKLHLPQAGVLADGPRRLDLLFVTLDKDEQHFSPTTRYDDYLISPTRFHWESQGRTRADSEVGRRYVDPPEGWQIQLFVRQAKHDSRGLTAPYLYLGPVHALSHEGERPMRIVWALPAPAPADWAQAVKVAAG